MKFIEWADELLKDLDAERRKANRRAMLAWMQSEGAQCAWNPLATTQKMTGSRLCGANPHGVQEYPSRDVGAEAVLKTLTVQGHGYQKIKRRLKNPDAGAMEIVEAIGESDWGTNLELMKAVLRDLQDRDIEPLSQDPIAQKSVPSTF